MFNLKKKRVNKVIKRIFSEEEGIGEYEAVKIKGIGFLLYQVEDNVGSISLFITKKKVDCPPREGNYVSLKLAYKGSFSREDESGYVYSNLKDNIYRTRDSFDTDEESIEILTKKISAIRL